MKIGFLFECGPQGADIKVCECLARKLDPHLEIVRSVTLTNKPNLLRQCGEQSALLLNEGCDLVVIVWDLYPAWREHKQRPCRHEDCAHALSALQAAQVPTEKVALICIEEELEAWLLSDGGALSQVLSRPTRPAKCNHQRHPDRIKNPKKRLDQLFRETNGRPYIDREHGERIARAIVDFQRLKHSPSFCRFALKVANRNL